MLVIFQFNEHVIDQSNAQKVEIGNRNTQLHTSKYEQRGVDLSVYFPVFFFGFELVLFSKFHISRMSGRI